MQPEEIKMQSPLLSVIIISHNQRSELRRCVDSVLAQNIPFEYEIILSDDRSTDGTFELAQEYAAKYPFITASQCNSDECKPYMTSERAGFNRVNGLKFAKGKYVVHVDGDDFYIGNDCFVRQVEMLEKHPECNICCQRYIYRDEEVNVSDADCVFSKEQFSNKVISIDEFIRTVSYIHNSACCMRKSSLDNKLPCFYQYDDVDITYQYMGKGKIALIDTCGFVYTRYKQGTASCFDTNDQTILWNTSVSLMLVAPQCTGSLFYNKLLEIKDQINYSLKNLNLSKNAIGCLSRFDVFLFRSFYKRNACSKMRLLLSEKYISFLNKYNIYNTVSFWLLYLLIVGYRKYSKSDFRRLV